MQCCENVAWRAPGEHKQARANCTDSMFRALFSLSFTSKFNELVLQKDQMVDKFKNDASRASASDTSSQSAGLASRTPSKSPSVLDASGSQSLPPPSSKPSSGA